MRWSTPHFVLLDDCSCRRAELRGGWTPTFFDEAADAIEEWARLHTIGGGPYYGIHHRGRHVLFAPGERPRPA